MKHSSITARLDPETVEMVDRLAKERGISKAGFAAEAIRRVAESDADFLAFVKVGTDAADRGDLIPHDEVVAELDGMMDKHRARCRS